MPPEIAFAPNCLSIDLEVGVDDARIRRFAAVRGKTGESFVFRGGDLGSALRKLDMFAGDVAFLLGHNIVAFDLVHLRAANPHLRLLDRPAVDTLRLNPLAFPRNPYHHLLKHYQDGQLHRGRINDPDLDARLTLSLLHDQVRAFQSTQDTASDLLTAWHWLTTADGAPSGLGAFFSTIRRRPRPTDAECRAAIGRQLDARACAAHAEEVLRQAIALGWPLAYALAWLSVSGGNSVMPPWVRHEFPEAGRIVKRLRDVACENTSCGWCGERHDARKELKRWFGFQQFRAEPVGEDGRPLQQQIVTASMRGRHVLGILPTGTGKSLCYQIPALSRYEKTGALTVVISPLVALMADQVAGLDARGITCSAALNGLLSMPERADVLDRVRLGDIGILIISPEQLRNNALRKVLAQREIGAWVLDEAHCVSKWGHDFRPDYRYVGRFIRERAGTDTAPPIVCLTATAKPDVIEDIRGHFREKLGVELDVFNGGSSRINLEFEVIPTSEAEKFAHVHQILTTNLPDSVSGGAIVYCAFRKQTEELAAFLRKKEVSAAHYHARLQPESKKIVQRQFVDGELRVIVATNAFGMGIDKPDVRLVVHADIPGSLESYLQEAGRAGRDRRAARCVLLYTKEDVERQFGMSARSRLNQPDIQAILRAIRRLDRKKRSQGEVVATSGEILAEDDEGAFERDSATDDTRVRTAIAWLEEAALLTREENRVQVFPSSLRIETIDEARARLSKAVMVDEYRNRLLALIDALIGADPDEGISTDELMAVSGLSPEKVRHALYDLERLGIAANDTSLTAFVHVAVERSSQKRFEEASALEVAFIAALRESAPLLAKGESCALHLRQGAQALKDAGHANALPEQVWRIMRSLASDGRHEDGGVGSVQLRKLDSETIHVTLQREWPLLEKVARLRRAGAKLLLEHLLACLPQGSRGTDLLAETTLGKLLAALETDVVLKAEVRELPKLLERALMWLHEQEVARLNKGFAVFRPAMTLHVVQERRAFVRSDYAPLKLHYDEQVVQIHVMAEYVQRGLKAMADALRLTVDYFSLPRTEFLARWLSGRDKELLRQTSPESWHAIVESLSLAQQRVVADDRERTNLLVLAGPGSGKTRVLVHRIAYLVRVRRENPRGILALAYNRHAAVEIRRRLDELIGDDANGVAVLTCHSLAMRITGVSFAMRNERVTDEAFSQVIQQAIAILHGDGLPPDDADEQRDRLLAGFRWILVDEYQDVAADQYQLIAAIAGRTLEDEERKLSLFAVGDDDQNIYAFRGASVEFIRRFETDYAAKSAYLTENYRSTANIIDVANAIIGDARERMKETQPIGIDRARTKMPAGGVWQNIDSVGKGRVQVIPAGDDALTQAVAVMSEFRRLATLGAEWDWARAAVIAREWKYLEPIRSYCALNDIPVELAGDESPPFWRLRETQRLVAWVCGRDSRLIDADALDAWLSTGDENRCWDLLKEATSAYRLETRGAELPSEHFVEWLAEWGRDVRRRQTRLLLLTAHRAKGLEFDHVAVLDGGWGDMGHRDDGDAERRLYYVATTRARDTLMVARLDRVHPFIDALPSMPGLLRRAPTVLPALPHGLTRSYHRLTLADVDLGFSGRKAPSHRIHRDIAALSAGDELELRNANGAWQLVDKAGEIVGQMAKRWTPPVGMRLVSGNVDSIVVRRRVDGNPEFERFQKCEQWEVIVPELVFERA